MGRSPVSDENGLKKGPWSLEEDEKLIDCIKKHGHGNWREIPKLAGLNRCPKSCRLRWTNYLRPDIKRGKFSEQEEQLIISLHSLHGNKWSQIASHLDGRTDNEIKNYWNTSLKKKLLKIGIDPVTHMKRTDDLNSLYANYSQLQANIVQLARAQLLQYLAQVININSAPANMGAIISAPMQDCLLNEYCQQNVQYQHLINSQSYPGYPNLLQKASFSTSQGQPSCSNILPALVSVSPESSIVNQPECRVNPNDIFTHSSTPTTFETSADYNLEIADNDCYWKDLMDNTTSPPTWTFSE